MTISDIVKFLQDEGLILSTNIIKDDVVTGISDDSRIIEKDNAFVAIRGTRTDGNDYITEAIGKYASLIVSDIDAGKNVKKSVSFVKVKDSRKALSLISSLWFDNPSGKLKIIGVTGTKGKTTVVHLIFHILKTLGYKVGMISTVKAVVADKIYDTGLHVTNPEPLLLQRLLSDMVKAGLEYAVVEVTSHGLDQERVYGINFDIGVLTNIAKEHLDYHTSFERYRDAKTKLFLNSRAWILNADDQSFGHISAVGSKKKEIISYSQDNKSDFTGEVLDISGNTMKYSVSYRGRMATGKIHLPGKYNLYNILASISAVSFLGIGISQAVRSLNGFVPPEGRLEKIDNNFGYNLYIDFAHTPDSLENLLMLLKNSNKGRLISVFGCAGERDKNKRYKMGYISGKTADITVITAEDPRSENVLDICNEIERGASKAGAINYFKIKDRNISKIGDHHYLVIPDRSEAIYYAIKELAIKGDTLVFCGKGHEKSMCYGSIEHPWSDFDKIKRTLTTDFERSAVVMGAGRGRRLTSDLPKVIHKLAEKPMIFYTLNNLRDGGYSDISVVVGYRSQLVMSELGGSLSYAYQKEPLGTGHAAWQGIKNIKGKEDVLVVNGDDSAFYLPETLSDIYKSHHQSRAVVTFSSIILKDPAGMGRLVRDGKGRLVKIVEEKAASEAEKKIKEVNNGMYVFDKNWFLNNIGKVKKGTIGEYYITDLIEIAIKNMEPVNVFRLKDNMEWCGVNTPEQLQNADDKMRSQIEARRVN